MVSRNASIGRIIVSVGVAVLCTGLASSARASCFDDMPGKFMGGLPGHLLPGSPAQYQNRPGIVAPQGSFGQGAKDDGKDQSIVGLWRVTFTSDSQIVDQGFDVWHSDGTEVLNDSAPPSSGNVCLGVWEQTGRRTFKLKHPSWTFDATGVLTGTAVIGEVVTVDRDGKSFKGTTTVDVYDLDDNLLFHLDGEITAKRITVD